ncbi:hypothetical protein CTAYLR_004327 [Chrysophaeum taylorii]|uniref:C2H2-type domain-containing protein n=1 Tax=Chrysophaeum taylorii TaxID=2483200 RepID=A0AAD7XMY9_9STRA|nr:hypothetical protein CTAYLR_004327 [Chrysophaeum taylorii]
MVRGHAKSVAQQKNQKKAEERRKAGSKNTGDDKNTKRALTCKICFASVIGEKALKEHFAAKHIGKELKLGDYGLG